MYVIGPSGVASETWKVATPLKLVGVDPPGLMVEKPPDCRRTIARPGIGFPRLSTHVAVSVASQDPSAGTEE